MSMSIGIFADNDDDRFLTLQINDNVGVIDGMRNETDQCQQYWIVRADDNECRQGELKSKK